MLCESIAVLICVISFSTRLLHAVDILLLNILKTSIKVTVLMLTVKSFIL